MIGILYGEGPLLTGERVFASERCIRLMAGDALIDELARGSSARKTSAMPPTAMRSTSV